MKLSHYSSSPISLNELYSTQHLLVSSSKPKGLWVSVDGEWDWVEWCIAEKFSNPLNQIRYRVVLGKYSNILIMNTFNELLDFTEEFGESYSPESFSDYKSNIRWNDVSKLYNGIIITPYICEARFPSETAWYYGWDCASGCIWNPEAIRRIYKMQGIVSRVGEIFEE